MTNKIVDEWEKMIDKWFGEGSEGGWTRGRFEIEELKSFTHSLLLAQREEMVEKISSLRETEQSGTSFYKENDIIEQVLSILSPRE